MRGSPKAEKRLGRTNEWISAICPARDRSRRVPASCARFPRRAQVMGDRRLHVGAGHHASQVAKAGSKPFREAMRSRPAPHTRSGEEASSGARPRATGWPGRRHRRARGRPRSVEAARAPARSGPRDASTPLSARPAARAGSRAPAAARCSPRRRSRRAERPRPSPAIRALAQEQHSPRLGGRCWIRGEEGELDRLPRDDDRLGLILRRRDRLEQPIGIGLQPRDLGRGRRRRRGGSPAGPSCGGSTRPGRPRSTSRHAFVAIRYSHARRPGPSPARKLVRARQAAGTSPGPDPQTPPASRASDSNAPAALPCAARPPRRTPAGRWEAPSELVLSR